MEWRPRHAGLLAGFLLPALVYWFFLRTDYQEVFESAAGVRLPEETWTVDTCEEWGVQAAVFEIREEAWEPFVRSLKSVSTTRDGARRYSGFLCDSLPREVDFLEEVGTVSGDHEGLVWALSGSSRRMIWEVWF
ncbi:MAG: hypothetical protein AAF845_04615 [Bacteroidota bacterium]